MAIEHRARNTIDRAPAGGLRAQEKALRDELIRCGSSSIEGAVYHHQAIDSFPRRLFIRAAWDVLAAPV